MGGRGKAYTKMDAYTVMYSLMISPPNEVDGPGMMLVCVDTAQSYINSLSPTVTPDA